jgi:hypothetical protein
MVVAQVHISAHRGRLFKLIVDDFLGDAGK